MRLDIVLVEKGLAVSRQKAKEYILSGKVSVNQKVIEKPSFDYEMGEILVNMEYQYVGRGAYKLLHAFKIWNIDVKNKICLDIGASTGGFTEILLQNEARKIYAVDVGTNQIAPKIAQNCRVTSIEQMDIRNLDEKELQEKINFFCIDISFISLVMVIPYLQKFLMEYGEFVTLIKPQFELGKGAVSKTGIVKSQRDREKAIEKVRLSFQNEGYHIIGVTPSPIQGKDGNIEYLIHGTWEKRKGA